MVSIIMTAIERVAMQTEQREAWGGEAVSRSSRWVLHGKSVDTIRSLHAPNAQRHNVHC